MSCYCSGFEKGMFLTKLKHGEDYDDYHRKSFLGCNVKTLISNIVMLVSI